MDSLAVPESDSSQLLEEYSIIGPSLELEEQDPLTIPGPPEDDRDAYERVSEPCYCIQESRVS